MVKDAKKDKEEKKKPSKGSIPSVIKWSLGILLLLMGIRIWMNHYNLTHPSKPDEIVQVEDGSVTSEKKEPGGVMSEIVQRMHPAPTTASYDTSSKTITASPTEWTRVRMPPMYVTFTKGPPGRHVCLRYGYLNSNVTKTIIDKNDQMGFVVAPVTTHPDFVDIKSADGREIQVQIWFERVGAIQLYEGQLEK